MADPLAATGLKTRREAVELVKIILQLKCQREIVQFLGKLRWQGELESMRTD
ncbi:type II toxin-antitoxin system VapB family antitoxin [Burkholderia sp. JPY481]|uniref:type II toxin-antitoxin system VapB family antitoxin n=1 Tax=Paraburkholderia sp. JPY465 TaxID=3042285 RepID=UPI00316BECA1